ncbi:MAG: alpha/beta hydrolase fold domain-containing protein [Steroidobacteraceae bacterium]|nr:alpha/beta hydrolase fold domain-containing protein [Steroidobacteraceae bacterium]
MLDEHRHIARLLVVLQQQVAALRQSGRADIGTVRAVMDYMTRYPNRHHHPKEDLVLAKVEAANPAIADIATELRRAHGTLARQGQALLALLPGSAQHSKRMRGERLRQLLADYIFSMRRHMHYEESILFEEAARLLRKADWKDIEAAVPSIVDPIFGETTAPEYEALLANYLNRVTAVATGQVPVGLFEIGASTAERLADTGRQIRGLPASVWHHMRSRATEQQRRIKTLMSSDDLGSALAALKSLGKMRVAGPVEYCSLVRNAVLARGNDHGDAEVPTMSASARDLSSEKRIFQPSNSAGVSWQAAALNVLLRSTMKPLFTSLDARRAKQVAALVARWQRPPPGIKLTPVVKESFRAEWVQPVGLQVIPRRTILYLPGGGFFLPATSMHVAMLAKIARMTRARALLVHYRLAPDHPFPAGLEDAIAAYRHLLDCGTSPQDIVIAGDSAGGCLTLSLLLALRQEKLPMPAGGAMLSALSDLNFVAPSRTYNKWRDPLLPTGSTSEFFRFYAGEMARDNPLVSPIYGDYHGFPPMFAQVGSTEILIDDTLLIARKARLQGADFEVEVWEGMPHVWQVAGFLPESRRALVRMATFLEKAWFRSHHPTTARRCRTNHDNAAA